MAQVLIRNLDENVVARLKDRAAEKHLSLEQFLRDLLTEQSQTDTHTRLENLRMFRENVEPFDFDFTAAIRSDRDAR